ncbi:hypothetical protein [uncultured Tateyamaria sp.]|nr:hypothetical protein [uncultured Tateyamaria sp.]
MTPVPLPTPLSRLDASARTVPRAARHGNWRPSAPKPDILGATK